MQLHSSGRRQYRVKTLLAILLAAGIFTDLAAPACVSSISRNQRWSGESSLLAVDQQAASNALDKKHLPGSYDDSRRKVQYVDGVPDGTWRRVLHSARDYTFAVNYADCPGECGRKEQWGECTAERRCICARGRGGLGCGFGAAELYGNASYTVNSTALYEHLGLAQAQQGRQGGAGGGSNSYSYSGSEQQRRVRGHGNRQLLHVMRWLFGVPASKDVEERRAAAGDAGGGSGSDWSSGGLAAPDLPQLVVQVGCQTYTAVAWGRLLAMQGSGLTVCVDPWVGPWATTHGTHNRARKRQQQQQQQLLQGHEATRTPSQQPLHSFLSAVKAARVMDYLMPMAALARDAAAVLGSQRAAWPDVVHLTASYAGGAGSAGGGLSYEELTAELTTWWPVLAPGGILLVGATHGSKAQGGRHRAASYAGGGGGNRNGGADPFWSPAGGNANAGGSGGGGGSGQLVSAVSGSGGGSWLMDRRPADPVTAAAVTAFARRAGVRARHKHGHWLLVKPAVGGLVAGAVAAPGGGGSDGNDANQEMQGGDEDEQVEELEEIEEGEEDKGPRLVMDDRYPILSMRDPVARNCPEVEVPQELQSCDWGCCIRIDLYNQVVVSYPAWASYEEPGAMGNVMGVYYQGLAFAQLLGFRFTYVGRMPRTDWRSYLPLEVPPGLICPNVTAVQEACRLCSRGNGHRDEDFSENPHDCPAGWTAARPVIRAVTRAALEAWAADTSSPLPAFEPHDAVIQVRCASDTLLFHDHYGPSGFGIYTRNLPPETKRVYALYARHGHNSDKNVPQCERLVQELGGYLTRVRPGTSFSTLEGEPWEDFARLVYAPVSFRDSQSSFGLWSTLSSTGLAFAPPMYSTSETCIEDEDFVAPYVDESYRFDPQAKALYPAVGKKLNITDSTAHLERIIQWLKDN